MIDPKFTKAVSSVITVQSETNTLKSVQTNELKYTLCDRDNIASKKGNFFVSFGLPTRSEDLGTGSTLSLYYPELQQLNVDQMIICPIPPNSYSEFIDGRSLTWTVPQAGGGSSQSSLSSVTVYSSTYSSDKPLRSETSPLLGDNVVFLFCDSINRPFSGSTVDEIGQLTNLSTHTTWEPDSTNYLRRPSAISYSEVKGTSLVNGFNTDARSNTNYAVKVPSNYPESRAGYNYDIPVGFAVMDKGFMVLTHTGLTSNFPWLSGFTDITNTTPADTLEDKTNVYFTGSTGGNNSSSLTFNDINTSFKSSVVCLAMPKEFYISNNPTWNREKALSTLNQQTGIVSIDPVYVTEIGLYNALGELIAVAKTSEPVEKTYVNLFNFSIDIEM